VAGPGAAKTGGRQAGTPNKITKALKEMILGALDDAGGQQYLATMAREQPAAFLTLLRKVLPTTLVGDRQNPLQTVSRVELIAVEPRPRDDLPRVHT
jgi:hypothetical protein